MQVHHAEDPILDGFDRRQSTTSRGTVGQETISRCPEYHDTGQSLLVTKQATRSVSRESAG